jgi:hypothetical protein
MNRIPREISIEIVARNNCKEEEMIPVLRPVSVKSFSESFTNFDGLVLLVSPSSCLSGLELPSGLSSLSASLREHAALDGSVGKTPTLIVTSAAPGRRLVVSTLGSLVGDTDDVRRFTDASRLSLAKCASIGIRRPLFVLPSNLPLSNPRLVRDYAKRVHVSLLGLLAESYVPLQTRESRSPPVAPAFEEIGFLTEDESPVVTQVVDAIEQGRFLARGGNFLSC